MRRLTLIAITFPIGVLAGVLVSDIAFRARRVDGMQTVAKLFNETMMSSEDSARGMLAVESLSLAESLRNNDVDGALRQLEGRIESARRGMESGYPEYQGSSEVTQRRVQDILARIQEYQSRYPWSPPALTEEEQDFLNRLGRLNPVFSGDGLIGMRVASVRAGSLFDEVGLRVGDMIVGFNGAPIGDEGVVERLWTTLEEDSEFEMLVRSSDGAERPIRYVPD